MLRKQEKKKRERMGKTGESNLKDVKVEGRQKQINKKPITIEDTETE